MKQDGRVICSSTPTYGEGIEAGNEAGYIVGMSTCYPQPGSIRISDGETLSLVSNYSSARRHIGVMGLFYLLVADPLRESNPSLHNAVRVRFDTLFFRLIMSNTISQKQHIEHFLRFQQMQRETVVVSNSNWAKGLIGVVIALSVIVAGYRGCLSPRESGFERVMI